MDLIYELDQENLQFLLVASERLRVPFVFS